MLNLGVEGMMLVGAVTGFAVTFVDRQLHRSASSPPALAGMAAAR